MKRQRPEMNFAVQDVTEMADFAQDQQFTVALDKGTLHTRSMEITGHRLCTSRF